MGECIAIDQLLVSRPLSLELLESGLVIDRGSRSEMVNVDVHDGVVFSLLRNEVLPQARFTKVSARLATVPSWSWKGRFAAMLADKRLFSHMWQSKP